MKPASVKTPPASGRKTAPQPANEADEVRRLWRKFNNGLAERDRQLLDRAAAGEKLKVVCYDLDAPYDTVQKRLKRWQTQLGLPSLQTLLLVWRIVHASVRTAHSPALPEQAPLLLRHAPALALEAALDERAGRYEVRLPESFLDSVFPGVSAAARPVLSDATRSLSLAEAVFSPAVWYALLTLAQNSFGEGRQHEAVVEQHRLFLGLVGVVALDQCSSDLARIEQALDESTLGFWPGAESAPPALPLLLTLRALGRHGGRPRRSEEARLYAMSLPQQRGYWERYADRIQLPAFAARDDVALWQRFCAAAHDPPRAMALLRKLTLDLTLAPLTGLCVSVALASPAFAADKEVLSKLWQAMYIARARHAQHFGLHPTRVLSYFTLADRGIPVPESSVYLSEPESLLDCIAPDAPPPWGVPRTDPAAERQRRRQRAASFETLPSAALTHAATDQAER